MDKCVMGKHSYRVVSIFGEVLGLLHQGLLSGLATAKGVGSLLSDRLVLTCNVWTRVSDAVWLLLHYSSGSGLTWGDVLGNGITSVGGSLLGLVESRFLRVRSQFLLSLAREIFAPAGGVVSEKDIKR